MKPKILLGGAMAGFSILLQPLTAAPPLLQIEELQSGFVRLSWSADAVGANLEQADNLGLPVQWRPADGAPANVGGRFLLTLQPQSQTRFFRLRAGALSGTTIVQTSPALGESDVAVTRETIFRFSGPLAPEITIDSNHLFAEFGGRRLLARAELSSDHRTVTLFYLENLPSSARVKVSLIGDDLRDSTGKDVDADGNGQPGGIYVLSFMTAGTAGVPNTAVVGHVFASERNPDGSNHPIEGAIVTVDGAEESLRTTTDASGFFSLEPAPAGRFFVHVDGRPAVGSQWPNGAYYPFIGKAWEAVGGTTNNLASGTGEIFLPLIQADALKSVSATEETRITFVPSVLAANPALVGVEVRVPPNTLFSENGTRGGKVGIAPVPPDRLPEPLPPGLNLPIVITIQTDGPLNFDRPVPVRFPNLPDPNTGVKLPAGAKTMLWSFNHDTGRWEAQGTATITPDGNFAETDPGVGVRQPGWHGVAPGTPTKGLRRKGPGSPNPDSPTLPDEECIDPCDPVGNFQNLIESLYQHKRALLKLNEEKSNLEAKANRTPQEEQRLEDLEAIIKRESDDVAGLEKDADEKLKELLACRETSGRCPGHFLAAAARHGTARPLQISPGFRGTLEGAAAFLDAELAAVPVVRPLPGPGTFFSIDSFEDGFSQRGRLNTQGFLPEIILVPDQFYRIGFYDSSNGRFGFGIFKSAAAGQTTLVPAAPLYPASAATPDSDKDGLPDLAEAVIGTAPDKTDSDGDGIKDGQEILAGTDPLDGVGLPVGVVAAAPVAGFAEHIVAANGVAVLPCGAGGLAIFEVTNPQNPIQVSTVPGVAAAVALRGATAVAAFNDGVRLLDLSNPAAPVKRWARTDLISTSALGFGVGSVFAVNGVTLHRLDIGSGVETGSVALPFVAESLMARGDIIYALGPGRLVVCRDSDLLGLVGIVDAPGSGGAGGRPRHLFVAGTLLYAQHNFGFNVFDITEPAAPTLVNDVKTGAAGWRHFVPSGTGLALSAEGPTSTPDGPHDVSLYRLTQNGTDAEFLTTFVTPGSAEAVAIAGGRGFVADGDSGLSVVNFLEPDLAGIPPTVALELDSKAVPPQAESDSLMRMEAKVTDDIAVHHVDFFVNGQSVGRVDSFPFELLYRVPAFSAPANELRVRLRAEDTAGNASETPEIVVKMVADGTPPAIAFLEPAPGAAILPAVISDVSAAFVEPIASSVSASSLSLFMAGPDDKLGTTDDAPVTGAVRYDAANKVIVFTAATPLAAGQYRATLAAGLADAAGNPRPRPLTWDFKTGPAPRLLSISPAGPIVRIGGTVNEVTVVFDQPLPKVLSDPLVLTLLEQGPEGYVEIHPITAQLKADKRTFVIQPPAPLGPGTYRVSGQGPNVEPFLAEFSLRDVPNEVTSTSQASGIGLISNWRYLPGPLLNDVLIINVPGQIAPIDIPSTLKSITAQTDIRFSRQTVNVEEPIQCLGALEIVNTRFGPGTTSVRGPLSIYSLFGDQATDIGAHTINAYGGGSIRTEIRFSNPNGALINHSGSALLLTNNASIVNTGVMASNAGRIVNLGTLRNVGDNTRLEDVRLRNDGRIEVARGLLSTVSIENEGAIDVAEGAKLVLSQRARGGINSSLTGPGALEFGEYSASLRRIIWSADAELKGDVSITGPLTIVGGNVTFWRPLVRPDQLTELQNQNASSLHLLGASRLGTLKMSGGTVSFTADSDIARLEPTGACTIETAALTRVLGDAAIRGGLFVNGHGILEMKGTTIVSNGLQQASVRITGVTLRNLGTWQESGGSAQGTSLAIGTVNGAASDGVFENAGLYEQTTANPLLISVPFRNFGRVVLNKGAVAFDGQTARARGVYLPQPGCELVLAGTALDHSKAGRLDLAAGIFGGTGSVRTVGSDEVKIINRATLRVGNPTGALQFLTPNGFEQTGTGEIAVTLAASDSSVLKISGPATLGGTIRVEVTPGFLPTAGQTFDVITFPLRTGEFSNLILPNLGGGRRLTVSYSDVAVTVKVE